MDAIVTELRDFFNYNFYNDLICTERFFSDILIDFDDVNLVLSISEYSKNDVLYRGITYIKEHGILSFSLGTLCVGSNIVEEPISLHISDDCLVIDVSLNHLFPLVWESFYISNIR